MRLFRCLFFLFGVFVGRDCFAASMVACPVAAQHSLTEAEQAFSANEDSRAEALYRAQLMKAANDPETVFGLTLALLHEHRLKDAAALVEGASAARSESAVLMTALGEVQLQTGKPWLAAETVRRAMQIDPCYAQLRLLNAQLLQLSSMRRSAAKEVAQAHALEPHDARISLRWLEGLPPQEQITQLEAYLVTRAEDDPQKLEHWRHYLKGLKEKPAGESGCRVVPEDVKAELPLTLLWQDPQHVSGAGLDVQVNDQRVRLKVDTGASGITVSRTIAERAGLVPTGSTDVEGIGSQGERVLYTATAKKIRVGRIEFEDCAVQVLDARDVLGSQGVIGMDVFARSLVTLDYPMRQLRLAQLPERPGGSGGKMPADRYVAPEMKDWVKVYRVGQQLLVPVSLGGKATSLFVVDTGAYTTCVVPEVANEVTHVHADPRLRVQGISGQVDRTYQADKVVFRFGHIEQQEEGVVAFDLHDLSEQTGMQLGGILGFNMLGQMTVNIDYRDGLVDFEFEPKRGFRLPGS